MKVAIDLDGTAWAHSDLFIPVVYGLFHYNHEVGILTNHHPDQEKSDRDEWYERGYGRPAFWISSWQEGTGTDTIYARKKAKMVEHNIAYLFDDLEKFGDLTVMW